LAPAVCIRASAGLGARSSVHLNQWGRLTPVRARPHAWFDVVGMACALSVCYSALCLSSSRPGLGTPLRTWCSTLDGSRQVCLGNALKRHAALPHHVRPRQDPPGPAPFPCLHLPWDSHRLHPACAGAVCTPTPGSSRKCSSSASRTQNSGAITQECVLACLIVCYCLSHCISGLRMIFSCDSSQLFALLSRLGPFFATLSPSSRPSNPANTATLSRPRVFGAQLPIGDGEHGQPTKKQASHHLAIALPRPSPSCTAARSLTASRVRTPGHERKPGQEATSFGNFASLGTLSRA